MSEENRLIVFSMHKDSRWLEQEIITKSANYSKVFLVTTHENREYSSLDNINFINPNEIVDPLVYKKRYSLVNDYVAKISKEILSREKFQKEFVIDGINLWWFVPKQVLSIFLSRKIIFTLLLASKVIEQFKPTKVIFDESYQNSSILKEVCQKNSVVYETDISAKNVFANKFNELVVNLFAGIKRRMNTRRISRWAKRGLRNKSIQENTRTNVAFIVHEKNNRQDYNIKGVLEKHDIYQKNIQLLLNEQNEFNVFTIGSLSKIAEIKPFEKISDEFNNTKYIPHNYYNSWKLVWKSIRVRRKLHMKLKRLFKNSKFVEAFSFENYSILDALRFTFFRQFKSEMVSGYENFHLFTRAYTDIKPKILVLYNEKSVIGKSAILAAKKLGIPTLALQHGNISLSSTDDYFVARDFICSDSEIDLESKCCHLASTFSAYSHYAKEILVKHGGLLEKNIVVTGCPRWDVILNKDCFNRKEFLSNIGLNPKKKTIVVLSQALPVNMYRVFFNDEVLKSIKQDIKEIQVIWKPHPRESEEEIKELVSKYQIEDIIVRKDYPLFDVLNASDIVITVHSTAGLEALLFDKPLITLIPEGEREADLLKNTPAVLKVVNQKELTKAINLILSDESTRNILKKGRKELIKKNLFFKGNASQLNAEMIRERVSG